MLAADEGVAPDEGVPAAPPLPLSVKGLGPGLEGVAESTLGGGRVRLGLLFDVCGRVRLGLLFDVCGLAECLPDTGFCGEEYTTLGGGRVSGGAVYPISKREFTGGN